jgi:hypothetical protein
VAPNVRCCWMELLRSASLHVMMAVPWVCLKGGEVREEAVKDNWVGASAGANICLEVAVIRDLAGPLFGWRRGLGEVRPGASFCGKHRRRRRAGTRCRRGATGQPAPVHLPSGN